MNHDGSTVAIKTEAPTGSEEGCLDLANGSAVNGSHGSITGSSGSGHGSITGSSGSRVTGGKKDSDSDTRSKIPDSDTRSKIPDSDTRSKIPDSDTTKDRLNGTHKPLGSGISPVNKDQGNPLNTGISPVDKEQGNSLSAGISLDKEQGGRSMETGSSVDGRSDEVTESQDSVTVDSAVDGGTGSRSNGRSVGGSGGCVGGSGGSVGGSGGSAGGDGGSGASTSATVKKSGSGNGGARSKVGHSLTRTGGQRGCFEFPLRILVSSDSVGAIIGKSGGTIKQITQESRARVDVLRKDSSPSLSPSLSHLEKEIAIYGPPDSCSAACEKILRIIMAEDGDPWSSSSSSDPVTLRILAHNSLVGRIIGKNGTTVKGIMESTDTRITVSNSIHDSDRNLFASDRVITVKGPSVSHVISAQSAITSKLRSSFESDQLLLPTLFTNQAMVSHPPFLPGSFHGNLGSGSLGSGSIRDRPGRSGGNHFPSPYGLVPGHPLPLPGHPLPLSGHPLPLSGWPVPFHPGYGSSLEDVKETAVLFVPQVAVGAIIGTGGATIRDIIQQSGANIKVSQPVKREGEESPTPTPPRGSSSCSDIFLVDHRKVTITGTPEGQWKAQYALFRKVAYETPAGPIIDPNLVVQILVPSSQVGRIIGKNGLTVRELQRITRAQIKLPEEGTTTGTETPVLITGDFFACQSAQRQIRSLVQRGLSPGFEFTPPFAPPGGGNRNRGSKSGPSGGGSKQSVGSKGKQQQGASDKMPSGGGDKEAKGRGGTVEKSPTAESMPSSSATAPSSSSPSAQ